MGLVSHELTFVFFVVFCWFLLSLSLVFSLLSLCPSRVFVAFIFFVFALLIVLVWFVCCVLLPSSLLSSCFSLLGGVCLSFPSSGNLPGFKLFFFGMGWL